MSQVNPNPRRTPPLQQNRPKRYCLRCKKDITSDVFSSSYCWECGPIIHEEKRKTEQAMWKSYCPFCKMLLAEHKQNEAQLCLYNLRGYVIDKITEESRS